jgi:hypothetical protein
LAFVSHGARIGVRVNDAAMLGRISGLIPPAAVLSESETVDELYSLFTGGDRSDSRVRRYNLLYEGAVRLVRTLDLEAALDGLRTQLELAVALRAPRRLFVRGGAIGWGDRAILLPGEDPQEIEGLLAALVRAGGVCYSARFAVLDGRGHIHPYVPTPRRDALPVGVIAFRGPDPVQPRVLSPGRAVIGLLGQAVASRVRPAYALRTLERAVASAEALELPLATPKELSAWLLDRFAFSLARQRAS